MIFSILVTAFVRSSFYLKFFERNISIVTTYCVHKFSFAVFVLLVSHILCYSLLFFFSLFHSLHLLLSTRYARNLCKFHFQRAISFRIFPKHLTSIGFVLSYCAFLRRMKEVSEKKMAIKCVFFSQQRLSFILKVNIHWPISFASSAIEREERERVEKC